MNKKLKIAVLNHSTNIGNHFFEISILSELRKLFKDDADVFTVEGRHIFTEQRMTGNQKDYLDYGKYTDADYFVVSGPVFQGKSYVNNFKDLFETMAKKGTKFIFMSAGSIHYDNEERAEMRSFLKNYPPYIVSTRDRATYESYGDLAKFSYDGICSAFYSSIHFEGYDTTGLGDYIVLNFEECFEPDLSKINKSDILETQYSQSEIDRCSEISKRDFLLDQSRKYPESFDGLKIIRPFHTMVPSLSKPLLRRPNKFVSVNPYSYLNIFKNAEYVLARRVHACVPALSYGKPAMLFNSTKRAQLFDRAGLSDITKKPVLLEKARLHEEHANFVEFLHNVKQDMIANM